MNAVTDEYINARELALVTRTRKRTIERLVSFELVKPAKEAPELLFTPDVVPRVNRLIRLHIELGVGWSSMEVVLELMDRVKYLEREIDR